MKPLMLDLFARAQGTSVGYARAGWRVTALDIDPYDKHPEVAEWVTADAFDVLDDVAYCRQFSLITASPNCEGYSDLASLPTTAFRAQEIPRVREKLERIGVPYVIENVDRARKDMINPVRLCGSMFDLGAVCRQGEYRQLRRHRLFDASPGLVIPVPEGGCTHRGLVGGVYGTGGGGQQTRGYRFWPEEAREAMGIDWMHRDDICKAIPPIYTQWIGWHLKRALGC